MKSSNAVANGVQTVFQVPPSAMNRFATVNGVQAVLSAQDGMSVTFAAPPAANSQVAVFYGNDIVVAPGTYTVTFNGPTLPAPAIGAALTLFLNVSAASGTTPNLACKLQTLDVVSGQWFDVPGATFTAMTAPGQTTLTLATGGLSTAGASVNQTIRNQYRVVAVITGTTPSFTFSIGSQA